MPSITNIADLLGMSVATVSRALNDKPGVSAETRQRVIQAAKELDYAPSIAARSLVLAKTNTIGFLFYERSMVLSNDPFYLHVMQGVEHELRQHGYFLMVSTVHAGDGDDPAKFDLVREKRVDGLILCSPFFSPRFILALKLMGIPLVLVDNYLNQTPVDCVLIDDTNGGYTATQHLIEHGHRQIAFMGGPSEWISNRAREAGYRRAMAEANLSPIIFHQSETTVESGHAAMLEMFQNQLEVTAVFCANDAIAFGVMGAAKEHKTSVPRNLAIVGFDDVEAARTSMPTLTTMRVPKRQLGVLAARRLVDLLKKHREEVPTTAIVPTELITRASCGCREKSAVPVGTFDKN